MEKISGILPSNSRIKSTDMKSSAPIRPGTPSFGRPEGISTLEAGKLNAQLDSTNSIGMKNGLDKQNWEKEQAIAVGKIADNFFMQNRSAPVEESTLQPLFDPGQVAQGVRASIANGGSTTQPPEDLDAPEVGRYVDVYG